MGRSPCFDRHDEPWTFNQFVPVETAMIEDVFIVGEDPVGELSRMSCQMFSTGLSSGDLDGRDERHVFRHAQLRGEMPSGPIHEQNGVSARLDGD